MRSVPFLLALLVPLAACTPAPISITKQDIARAAPDVMSMPVKEQQQAGDESLGGQCPALTDVASLCLITIDEARAEK